MICKDSALDLQQQQQKQQQMNGYSTVQHRHKKSQLITFSSSSHDLKYATTGAGRNSIISTASSNGQQTRFSFAEEDIMTINQHNAANTELEDEVFRRHSLEADQGVEGDADMDEELFDDELIYCGTHISASLNANDDSGGGSGSYEDSHALHSSIGGSNRNSLEKDDDDVDVISTDVSCYDQLVGSAGANVSLILGHDEDAATLRGDHNDTPTANYAKLKITLNGHKDVNGGGVGGGGFTTNMIKGGDCAGSLYANPFMDDEGIAESGM